MNTYRRYERIDGTRREMAQTETIIADSIGCDHGALCSVKASQ